MQKSFFSIMLALCFVFLRIEGAELSPENPKVKKVPACTISEYWAHVESRRLLGETAEARSRAISQAMAVAQRKRYNELGRIAYDLGYSCSSPPGPDSPNYYLNNRKWRFT